jgi:hypothetical protein
MYFDSELIYIDSKTTARERITAINAIIDAMLGSALKAALTANKQEYMLNDGQTTIKTIFRSPQQIADAVIALETLASIYKSRINNPGVRLVDSKNFFPYSLIR